MTFSVSYTTVIEAESLSTQDNAVVGGKIDSFAADYASKLTYKLNANQETSVEIPGLNAIVSLMLVADNPVNISLGNDLDGNAVYDGVFSRQICKFFGITGIVYDHIKVKAGLQVAEVTLVVIGREALPTV